MAAAASTSALSLEGLFPDARSIRSASTEESLSSITVTGTDDCRANDRLKPSTFRACVPFSPDSVNGIPTTICVAWCCATSRRTASISVASTVRSIVVTGLARVPVGSLAATPMRLSPTSRASTDVNRPGSSRAPARGPGRGRRRACRRACLRPERRQAFHLHRPGSLLPRRERSRSRRDLSRPGRQ